MNHRILAALILLFCIPPVQAGLAPVRPPFPPLTGPVVDLAHLLPANIRTQLAARLSAYARANGKQLVVVTFPTLNGYPIDEYGYRLGRKWGIGQKHKDNGALLLVDAGEHQVRIEVGYGLEGRLTDATSSEIIRNIITPRFRAGHMAQGIVAGTAAILQVMGGSIPAQAPLPPTRPAHRGVPVIFLIVGFYLFLSILRTRGAGANVSFWPGMLLGFGLGGGLGGLGGGFGGGGGLGGFSGGGGSFGGGGASGGW